MSKSPSGNGLFLYVPVIILAAVILYFVFLENFRKGEFAGRNAPPPPEGKASAKASVDMRALARDASLAGKGKTLFQVNCATCHGPEGDGDGPRAASLNPSPRNYHSEKLKFGDDVVSLYNTLLKGSPGTSMPSFGLLPAEDVWAMVQFVHSLIPNATPTTDEIVSTLPEVNSIGGGASAATPRAAPVTDTSPRIPINLALQRMAKPGSQQLPARLASFSSDGSGIYALRCASCHGAHGEGRAVRLLNVGPYRYEYAASLARPQSAWAKDRNKFADVVVKGLPGRLMPGNGSLTRQQMDALFDFVREMTQTR